MRLPHHRPLPLTGPHDPQSGAPVGEWVAVADLCGGQHGPISAAQLRGIGFSETVVKGAVDRGLLRVVHRGVYAFGNPRLTFRGRAMAAVLATGSGSQVTHWSGGILHGFLPEDAGVIHVSSTGGDKHPGIRKHRPRMLSPTVLIDGVPTTSVARILVDVAATEPRSRVEFAVRRAHFGGLIDQGAIRAELRPGRRGTRLIAGLTLGPEQGVDLRSRGEMALRRFLIGRGLPLPLFNEPYRLNGRLIRPDARWPAQRVVVEIDHHASHGSRPSIGADAMRHNDWIAEGHLPFRFVREHFTEREDEVYAQLAPALTTTRRSR